MTSTGAAPFTNLMFRLDNSSGANETVYVSEVWRSMEDDKQATIIFRNDDSLRTLYTEAYPRMSAYGWKTFCSVIGGNIDAGPTTLTTAMIQELANAGWEQVSHGYKSKRFDSAADYPTPQDWKLDLLKNRKKLRDLGIDRIGLNTYVWPEGNISSGTYPDPETQSFAWLRECQEWVAFGPQNGWMTQTQRGMHSQQLASVDSYFFDTHTPQ